MGVPDPLVIGRGVTDPAPDQDRSAFHKDVQDTIWESPDLDPSVFNKFEGTDKESDQNPDPVPPDIHVLGRPGRGFRCISASYGSISRGTT